MYKIIDNQGGQLKRDRVYESLEEIKDDLQDFHSTDNENARQWSLIDCLEMGLWAITDMQGNEIDTNLITI